MDKLYLKCYQSSMDKKFEELWNNRDYSKLDEFIEFVKKPLTDEEIEFWYSIIDTKELKPIKFPFDDYLEKCVVKGDTQGLDYLVSKGGNVNLWDDCLVCFAAERGQFEMVKYLVENYNLKVDSCKGCALV